MQCDLEDMHPSMQEIMKKNEEFMRTQRTDDNPKPVMERPAGLWDDEDDD